MTHLSHEQLSALHDGALDDTALAAAEAHLATCDDCREALAELAAVDRALDAALAHDPGDAYFADFASRVQARIAAEAAAAEVPPAPAVRPIVPAPKRRSWFSPGAFGFAGAAAALVVTAGLAWMLFGRTLAPTGLMHASEVRSNDAPAPAESPLAAQAAPEPAATSAPAPQDGVSPSDNAAGTRADQPAVAPLMKDATPLSPRPQTARALQRDEHAADGARRRANAEARRLATPPPASNEAMVPTVMSEVAGASEPSAPTPTPAATPAPAPPAMARAEAEAPSTPAQKSATPPPAAKAAPGAGWGSVKSLYGPTAPTPAPALAGGAGKSRALVGQSLDLQQSAAAIEPACGVVRDSRGTPLGSAQLTLLGATTRSTRSAKDGTFCLDHPVMGDTLLVMRVGYEPVRLVLVSSAALTLALEPVGTLGSQEGLVAGGSEKLDRLGTARDARGFAPAPDVYAREAAPLREAVSAARESAAMAARDRSSAAWEQTAAAWRAIGAATRGAASYDARFRELSALREAWLLAPTAANRERFEQATAAFLADTPRTLPERATVQRWQLELRRRPAAR